MDAWNYLIDEFSKMGVGSEYLAYDDPSYKNSKIPGPIGYALSLFREGIYLDTMRRTGAALHGQETWNAVRKEGPYTVSPERKEEIADEMSDFLTYLYKEGGLAQYGIEQYSAP